MSASGTQPFHRVLVANRGEIAVRVMRTCRELGIETVAVYSDIDRTAPHVLYADYAVALGGESASESYLQGKKIIAAALESGADAIHPGYGFLSENADFADDLVAAGLCLIGPPALSMRQMGDKTRARATVMAAHVPVVPGNSGPEGRGFADADTAKEAAAALGYPVLLKASAGGGGKGMRLVNDEGGLALALESARREAESSFGDPTVYMERAVTAARHIEIQVFADNHGNVVHLGERDCSIQRRHQKVVEEAPSPVLDTALREKMGAAAIRATRATAYCGAGTVEFLLAPDQEFYFLEMNTRLQVEHPVTEQIHDLDLVAWQLHVAQGGKLPLDQPGIDARRRGHSIEARIYAEHPVTFMPSPGTITRLREPGGPGVRIDSGVYEGAAISPFYDPMIAKLVTWGEDRVHAIARMRRALSEYAIGGIETNLPFLRALMGNSSFVSGNYDTEFLARESVVGPAMPQAMVDVAIAGALIHGSGPKRPLKEQGSVALSTSRWRSPNHWRSG